MTFFWHQLKQPFVGSAPMDGITDCAFRQVLSKFAKPDVIFTEFVNVEGLCHNASQLLKTLQFSDEQRPVVAQIYGKTPESFRQATILICELGFDGVDINMGCPSKSVAGGGSGAGLINAPDLALAIIEAVRSGVSDWVNGANITDCQDFSADFCQEVLHRQKNNNNTSTLITRSPLPVSIKTRIGVDKPELEGWLSFILKAQPEALTIHGRTLKQAYKGEADWAVIAKVAELAREQHSSTLIIGNGDVQSRKQGEELANKFGLAGVLIGRAMQGNPFVFSAKPASANSQQFTQLAVDHARAYEQAFSHLPRYSFLPMRKHLAWYIKAIPQAKEIRQQLVRCNSSDEVKQIFDNYQLS